MTGLIHISAPVEWIQRITMFAKIKGLSRSELIRKSVDSYLMDFKAPIDPEGKPNG